MEAKYYFDYNATSPLAESVIRYLQAEAPNDWANTEALYGISASAARTLKESRQQIEAQLGVSEGRILFTSGATESINSVLSQTNLRSSGADFLAFCLGDHSAVLESSKRAARTMPSGGFPLLESGDPDFDKLEELLSQTTRPLITVAWINNELGTVLDVNRLSKLARKYHGLIHLDGAQVIGKIPVDLSQIDADFVSFSGHKFGGLKGTGMLYVREPSLFSPHLVGGGHEYGLRAGTVNLMGIKALGLALGDSTQSDLQFISLMKNKIESKILQLNPRNRINGLLAFQRTSNTINAYFEGIQGWQLVSQLSEDGLAISAGSACHAGSFAPSHVIRAMGYDNKYASSCVRISLGRTNDLDSVEVLLAQLERAILSQMRGS